MTCHSGVCSCAILFLSGNVCRLDDVSFWCVFLRHSIFFCRRMSPQWHLIMAYVLMTFSFLTRYVATMTCHYGVCSWDIFFPSNDVVATVTCHSGECSYDIHLLSDNVCRQNDVSFWCMFLCHSLSFWRRCRHDNMSLWLAFLWHLFPSHVMSPRWHVILKFVIMTSRSISTTHVFMTTNILTFTPSDVVLLIWRFGACDEAAITPSSLTRLSSAMFRVTSFTLFPISIPGNTHQ